MYIVLKNYIDLEHGRKYEMGEEYPAKGLDTTPERVEALASGNNKAGIKLIKEVKASKPKAEEPTGEPTEEPKPKAKKGGKKASK